MMREPRPAVTPAASPAAATGVMPAGGDDVRRRRRAGPLVAALALLLLAAACEVDIPEDPEDPDGAEDEEEEAVARVLPLTGIESDDDEVLGRPPVVVKVDNLAPARPQTGVSAADVVMVEPVEGATRLMAFFHSTDPGDVGPVRSGRLLQAEMLPPFDAVLAMSGAHGPVDEEIRKALPVVFSEGQTPGWTRSDERRAPHNLYVDVGELWEAAPELPAPEQVWPFGVDAPDGGEDTNAFEIEYPRAGNSGWEWGEETGRWLRSQDGEPHLTAGDGHLAADTVIVVTLPTTDRERLPVDPVGEGEATVFRDGRAYEAQWRKPSADAHMEFLGAGGEPFPVKPGTTWVELLPDTGTLDIDEPTD